MAAKKTTTKKAAGKPAVGKTTAAKKTAPQKDEKKMSALDAAAKVLGESKEPMRAKEMIDAMAANGYWTSPGGQTPSATIYSSILREIQKKGKDARFRKVERGRFELNR